MPIHQITEAEAACLAIIMTCNTAGEFATTNYIWTQLECLRTSSITRGALATTLIRMEKKRLVRSKLVKEGIACVRKYECLIEGAVLLNAWKVRVKNIIEYA